MKWVVFASILFFGGCTAQKPVQVAVNPTPTTAPTTQPAPKPTTAKPKSKAAPAPEDVFRARTLDGRFEATGVLMKAPVEVRDVQTKRVLAKWNDRDGVTGLSFSPDGKMLVVNAPEQLTVWNWRSKKKLHVEKFDKENNVRISSDFSRDGRWLAASDGTVWLFDTRSWKKKHFDLPMTTNVVFAPNSQFVVVSQWDIGVAFSLIFVGSNKVREIKGESRGAPMFSRDGRLMVLMIGKEGGVGVQIWDVSRARLKRKLAAPSDNFWPDALSPDARFLVGQANDGEVN